MLRLSGFHFQVSVNLFRLKRKPLVDNVHGNIKSIAAHIVYSQLERQSPPQITRYLESILGLFCIQIPDFEFVDKISTRTQLKDDLTVLA
jgi:hypothetical protein